MWLRSEKARKGDLCCVFVRVRFETWKLGLRGRDRLVEIESSERDTHSLPIMRCIYHPAMCLPYMLARSFLEITLQIVLVEKKKKKKKINGVIESSIK